MYFYDLPEKGGEKGGFGKQGSFYMYHSYRSPLPSSVFVTFKSNLLLDRHAHD